MGFWNSTPRLIFFQKQLKKLYIRKAYEDLFQIICNNLESITKPRSDFTRMAITGTPGIGKSMFLFYILWRLANMETTKTVILRRQIERGGIYVFQNDGCWVTSNYYRCCGSFEWLDLLGILRMLLSLHQLSKCSYHFGVISGGKVLFGRFLTFHLFHHFIIFRFGH